MFHDSYDSSDEFNFCPSGSSNLSSLFDSGTLPDDLNSSLTYTAPKQPKAKMDLDLNESKSKPSSSVLMFKFVFLWKLLFDRSYKALGKHGLVLIGSQTADLFEIIAYQEKTNILVRRQVNNSKFRFFNQKDNFSTFHDNFNNVWLVKFDNLSDQNSFSKEIEKYGATIVNLEEAIERIEKQPASVETSISGNPTSKPVSLPKLKNAEENSDSSGSHTRANILSRMARMGQQILPNQIEHRKSTDISDSEVEESNIDRKVPPRKFKRASHAEKSNKEVTIPPLETQIVAAQGKYLNTPVALPQVTAPVIYSQPIYDGFNQLIVAQNAELKINMAQISSKLDNVLSRSSGSCTNANDKQLKSKIKALELMCENLQAELRKFQEKYYDLEDMYIHLKDQNIDNSIKYKDTMIDNLNEQIIGLNFSKKARVEEIADYKNLQATIEKFKIIVTELEEKIEAKNLKIQGLEKFYDENKDSTNLQAKIDNLQENIASLRQFEEYYNETEAGKEQRTEENARIKNSFTDKVKGHLSDMYQSIISDINHKSSDDDLKSKIAQYLKRAALDIIKDYESPV